MTKEELDELKQKLSLLEKERDAVEKEYDKYCRLESRVSNLKSKIADEIRRNAAGKYYLNDYFCPPNLYYYAIDSVDDKKWSGKQACFIFPQENRIGGERHIVAYASEFGYENFTGDALKLREVTREEFEKALQLVDYYENHATQLDKDIEGKMKDKLGISID